MPSDVCDRLAACEQVRLLRGAGFDPLLDAIEEDDPDDSIFFKTTGNLSIGRLAEKMGVSNAAVATILSDARQLLEGKAPWPIQSDIEATILTPSSLQTSSGTIAAIATAAAFLPASI